MNSTAASTTEIRTIAVAGNPNCGKTTLFNALSGLHYKVANYPGVTVERKEGQVSLSGLAAVQIFDLPGIYNLAGHSLDEIIATQSLLGITSAKPTLVLVVLDATNLERNLYLLSQIIDLGIPVVVALNMSDLAKDYGLTIRTEILWRELDVPVIAISAKKRLGIETLKSSLSHALCHPVSSSKRFEWIPNPSPFRTVALSLGHEVLGVDAPKNEALLEGVVLLTEIKQASSPEQLNKAKLLLDQMHQGQLDCTTFEATCRYQWINQIVRRCCSSNASPHLSLLNRIDEILTHRVWGLIIFALIMGAIFQSIFLWATVPMEWIDGAISTVGSWLGTIVPEGELKSLLIDGVIAGVGSVLIFVPQIAILFFFLGLLEDSGYLSRAAYLMDRLMRPLGLQGRSFIPLLSSFACAIPGILSTRTIPAFSDRLATILIAPLMSCSARLPVYALLIAAFIPAHAYGGVVSLQGLVLAAMYILGIVGAGAVAFVLKSTILRGEPALFVMEMPPFRRPSLRNTLRGVYDRVMLFLQSAGTVILACSVLLWFLATYPKTGDIRTSFAGHIGGALEPVLAPLGYSWEIGIALLASFAAREVFVSALSTVYNVQAGESGAGSLVELLRAKHADGSFSLATALSLMVFYVFACQCMSTLAVCKRETGSWRWVAFMFSYMTALAYGAAWLTYHLTFWIGGL